MALLLKVKWIEKSEGTDLCQRITHIGGQDGQFQWRHTHADAVESIEKLRFHYYMEKDARVLKVKVGLTSNGDKYLTGR
jgi:hypothetical protein